MAVTYLGNTLINNDSSKTIAYIKQLKDDTIKNYINNLSDKDKGRVPSAIKDAAGVFQQTLNNFFLQGWLDFQRFLLDEGVDQTIIDSWKEVQDFLNGLPDDETTWLKNKLTQLDNRITAMDIPDGGAYDVSADHVDGEGNYAVYVDLSAALAAVPSEKQKPGMSIRFIQGNSVDSSDNKYVQYRFMLSTFTAAQFANATNWQGVDSKPTINSKNLIESRGVAYSNNDIYHKLSLINGNGKYQFYANSIEHVSSIDKIEVNCKKDDVINITLHALTAVTDAQDVKVVLRNSDGVLQKEQNIALDQEVSIVVPNNNVVFIGFYIYRVTTFGVFEVEFSYNSDYDRTKTKLSNIETNVSNLETNINNNYLKKADFDKYTSNNNLVVKNIESVIGDYQYSFVVNTPEHSSAADVYEIDYKANTILKGKISLGTAEYDGSSLMAYLYNSSMTVVKQQNVSIGTEFSITTTNDAKYIGFYIYKVTTYGTFNVSLKYKNVVDEIDKIRTDIVSINSNINAIKTFDSGVNKDIYGRVQYSFTANSVEHSSGIDKYEIAYKANTVLKGTLSLGTAECNGQQVIAYLKKNDNTTIKQQDIVIGQEFTITSSRDADTLSFYIYKVTTYGTFIVNLEYGGALNDIESLENGISSINNRLIKGAIDGIGSINLKRTFKEITINVPITQGIFDTSLYNVGTQSFAIYDVYCIYVINATLKSDSNQQKIGVVIVELRNKTKLGEFEVTTENTMSHGNNVSLGGKYSNDDTIPLVYISTSYNAKECVVIRISNTFDSYTKVQEIKYTGSSHFVNMSIFDWIVDGRYIWTYGGLKGASPYAEFVKFNKPATTTDKTFTDADVIDSFIVNGLNIPQGAFIDSNRIYIGLGYDSGDEFVKVVDCYTHGVISILPLTYEPEGLSIYNGKVSVVSSGFSFKTYEDAFD